MIGQRTVRTFPKQLLNVEKEKNSNWKSKFNLQQQSLNTHQSMARYP